MRQGFTLIQISLLLMAASLVLVTVLPGMQNTLSANINTTNRMNSVLVSLRQYQASHGRFPCPADASLPIGVANYGVEAANAGGTNNCIGGTPAANFADTTNNIAIGMVPVKSLSLSNDYSYDDFGHQITYAVDTNATAYGWPASTITGKIVMTDNSTTATSILALLSHGADGHGAWIPLTGSSGSAVRLNAGSTDTDQLTNAHVNSSFVATSTYTSFVKKVATSTFDDLVVYKNPLWTMSIMPTQVPRISSASGPANGCYSTGQSLNFTLVYNKSVTITGTPRIAVTIGVNTRYANYASGSGTATLTFTYVVIAADSATGISTASTVDGNGGSIMTGNAYAITGFTAPTLTGVSINCGIYVTDNNNNRVQKFDNAGAYVSQFGTNGAGNGQFNKVWGIAKDASGNYYVADNNGNRVEKFDSSGAYLSQFGTGGAGNGQFSFPRGIAIDASGNLYVADSGNNRVQKFNSTGAYVSQFGTSGSGNGQFNGPRGIAIDASGSIYVVDANNNRVQKFDSTGAYLSQFGTSGSGNGQFNIPQGIAIDASGNLYVCDSFNNRVQKFNSAGVYVSQFGTSGSGNGQFNSLRGIAIDASGNIYVVDTNNNRVQKFDSSGVYVSQFGTSGSGNGQFNQPSDISIAR